MGAMTCGAVGEEPWHPANVHTNTSNTAIRKVDGRTRVRGNPENPPTSAPSHHTHTLGWVCNLVRLLVSKVITGR